MSFSATPSLPSLSSFRLSQQPYFQPCSYLESGLKRFCPLETLPRLHASRRSSNFTPGSDGLIDDPRSWGRSIASQFDGDEDEEGDEDEDDDEDRSLDLLVRFVENMFKKISKRARRAVRSVLPISISTRLVGFSVNGVLMLAFLWVLKAFLEVICTIGSVVFVSILLIRGIWTGIAYLQEVRNQKLNEFDDDRRAWTGAQPSST